MNKAKAGHRTDAPPSPLPVAGDPAPAASPSRRDRRSSGRWRLPGVPLVVALVCVIGAGILLYPSAAAWFSSVEQSQRIDDLSAEVHDLGAETLQASIERARAYNFALQDGTAAIAANERLPLASAPEGADDYASLLRGDTEGLMARIKIPSINVDLPIFHGTGETALQEGIGHLEGTALPVGGQSTHSVLTGHRGLATSELFTHLDRVADGDTFTIEVFGEVLTYRVIETRVVQPEDTESLFPKQGEDLITLVTCTPLGVNTHRILVTGERIVPTPIADIEGAGTSPDIPGFPWWMVTAGGVVVLAGAYVWYFGRPVTPRPARVDAAQA